MAQSADEDGAEHVKSLPAKRTNSTTNASDAVPPSPSGGAVPAATLPRKGGKRRRRFDALFRDDLPRSASVICSNSMVHDLDDGPKARLREYVVERCPGSEEVADALFWAAEHRPKELRTKELCETLEAVTLIGAYVNALLADDDRRGEDVGGGRRGRRRHAMTIYDLACGHGLGGTLLAYRFPRVRVICVDAQRRPCWTTYREAFERFGSKAHEDDEGVTSNLTFRTGDLQNPDDFRPERGDYLMCLHGCNELTPFVLSAAKDVGAGYAVMPCCLRDGMLGVSTTSSNNNWGVSDDASRYALQVGYLAGRFGCPKVAAISSLITNRYLIVIGDWYAEGSSSEGGAERERTTAPRGRRGRDDPASHEPRNVPRGPAVGCQLGLGA